MSNYREMYEDISKMEKEDKEDPTRPLLRERYYVLRDLDRINRELEALGYKDDAH